MKVKNIYPNCYKDEAERQRALKQAYQKIVIKLVLEKSKEHTDQQTS